MSVKGKSAKGVVVDFDLLKIKEQMAAAPPSIDVRKRQDFIENRLRRRGRKKVPQELLDKANAAVDVAKEMPDVEGEVGELMVEEKAAPKKKVSPKTKQKARPKAKTEE